MNTTLAIIEHPLLKPKEVTAWEDEHPHAEIFLSFKEALETPHVDVSLFYDPQGVKIVVDDVSANDFRELMRKVNDDILVVSTKAPRANFAKDGVEIIQSAYPKNELAAAKMLSKKLNLELPVVRKIMSSSDNTVSKVDKVWQYSFIDDHSNYSYGDLYEVRQSDNPPWDITNAIIDGNGSLAAKNVRLYVSKMHDPRAATTLSFQLLGYFRKVIASRDDKGGIVGNMKFFGKSGKRIHDLHGLTQDLSEFSQYVVKNGNHDTQILCAMVASMSNRFKR